MRGLWPVNYIIFGLFAAGLGYWLVQPAQYGREAPPVFISGVLFGIMLVVPLLALWSAKRMGTRRFRRPSWDRHPFSRMRDPLQYLRVTLIMLACVAAGAAASANWHEPRATGMVYAMGLAAMGLFIGERVACFVYRKRLIAQDARDFRGPQAN